MRKPATIVAAMLLALTLSGCTAADVAGLVAQYCRWVPSIVDIARLITKFTGSPPGAEIGFEAAETLAKKICAAREAQRAAERTGARAYRPVGAVRVDGVMIRGRDL